MKKLLITFGALIILTSCGYSSEDECLLKEMQKCDSVSCELQARNYCDDEFPAKKTWDIYKKTPKSWVNIEVDSSRIKFKPSTYRYETIKICLKKNWSLRKGRCAKMSLNQYSSSKNGIGWTERDSDRDYFHDYINLDGDGLKENTKVVVTKKVEVGFFRYYVVGTLFLILKILAVGFVITILVLFFNGELKTEDEVEVEVEDEEIEEAEEIEDDEDEMVEIPEREELELMTKVEIKEWADAFGFNVPTSLSKEEMVERFVQKTNLYIEEELKKLKNLYDKGLIDEELYNEKQKELLD